MDELLKLLTAAGDGANAAPVVQAVVQCFGFSPVHLAALGTLAGGTLLMAALLPEGLRRALGEPSRRPLRNWLLGFGVLLVLGAAFAGLLVSGVRPGRGLLLFALVAGSCAGTAVAARWLGERLAGDTTPLTHLLLGLAIVLLCLSSPFGLPVVALLTPAGLGALLVSHRRS